MSAEGGELGKPSPEGGGLDGGAGATHDEHQEHNPSEGDDGRVNEGGELNEDAG